jgi:hypothetical protein
VSLLIEKLLTLSLASFQTWMARACSGLTPTTMISYML